MTYKIENLENQHPDKNRAVAGHVGGGLHGIPERIPELDGLRGVTLLVVVLHPNLTQHRLRHSFKLSMSVLEMHKSVHSMRQKCRR
jgi:hypothetical protein